MLTIKHWNQSSPPLTKEHSRINKLEERLIASEQGRLRSQKARNTTAIMINKAMRGAKLPGPIINFLQGPWFDSIQLLALTKGLTSEEWFRASKLTETLIWTFQPMNGDDDEQQKRDKQRLYRIVESIPGEIRDLLVSLEHNLDQVETSLDEIEAEHVLVVTDQTLDYRKFKEIETQSAQTSRGPNVSRTLLRKVQALRRRLVHIRRRRRLDQNKIDRQV